MSIRAISCREIDRTRAATDTTPATVVHGGEIALHLESRTPFGSCLPQRKGAPADRPPGKERTMLRTNLRNLGLPLLGGCAVALALVAGGGAANGGNLILGQANSATAQTSLTGTVGGNAQLRVENGAVAAGSSALLGR